MSTRPSLMGAETLTSREKKKISPKRKETVPQVGEWNGTTNGAQKPQFEASKLRRWRKNTTPQLLWHDEPRREVKQSKRWESRGPPGLKKIKRYEAGAKTQNNNRNGKNYLARARTEYKHALKKKKGTLNSPFFRLKAQGDEKKNQF